MLQTLGEDGSPLFEKPLFDPNNKQWANDQTGFGFRMLQKMGWTPGKGLGQKEDGRLTNVTMEFKDDNLGIGIKAHQADRFEKQQQEFSDTLKSIGNLFERKALEQKQVTLVEEKTTLAVTTTTGERRRDDREKKSKEERRQDKQARKEQRRQEKQERRERRKSSSRGLAAPDETAEGEAEETMAIVPKKTHSHYIPNRVINGKSVSRYSKEDLAQIFQSVPLDEPVKKLEVEQQHSRVDVKIDDSFCKIAQVDSKEYFKAKLGRPEPPKHELVYVPSKKVQESRVIEMSVESSVSTAILTVSSAAADNGDDANQNKRKRRDEKKAKKEEKKLKKQKLEL